MDIAEHPWQVICPGCKKMIPGFDARAYLLSGRDSRGWFSPARADAGLLPRRGKLRQRSLDAMKSYSYHYWHWGFTPALDSLAAPFLDGRRIDGMATFPGHNLIAYSSAG